MTDYSNASRTLLFDIHRLDWDHELCELLGVPPAVLPEAAGSAERLRRDAPGRVLRRLGAARGHRGRPAGGAVRTGLHERRARQEHLRDRQLRADERRRRAAAGRAPGLLTTVAWGLGDRTDYALEASVFVTGAAVQWLRDGLGLIIAAEETEAMAASLDSNDGVYFVPALTGLGSPHWDPYARGTIVGPHARDAARASRARGARGDRLPDRRCRRRRWRQASGERLAELRADGGATANAWLMQFQADVLGRPVVVPEITETTALGAAYLAGVGTGAWTLDQVWAHCGARRRATSRA